MSPVLGRPPRAPCSRPVKPGATALRVGEGTTATGGPTGAPRATGPDRARRSNAGPRGTPERHAAGHIDSTGPAAKQQRPLGAANRDSAHHNHTTTAREAVPSNTQTGEERPAKRTHTARGAPGGSGEARRRRPGRGRGVAARRRRGESALERPDTADWNIRGGPSSRSRHPADWRIRGQAPQSGS